jgi:hypothetical protein
VRTGYISPSPPFDAAAKRGLWPLNSGGFSKSHTIDRTQSVGLHWTSDQLVAETSTWQHTTLTTDRNHATGGIRIHDVSIRAVSDLRLRSRGNWDRHWIHLAHNNKTWWVLLKTVLKGQFADQQIVRAFSYNRRVTDRNNTPLATKYIDTRVATQLYL